MAHHNHSTVPEHNINKAFLFGIILNVLYIVVEVVYGILINSMALIADAGHNFSDVLGLILAWGASYLAKTAATEKRTYGLRKSTILAALFNAIILMIAVGAITIEAIRNLIFPATVHGQTMMLVAGIGFFINAATAILFIKGKEKDLNIKGAFLHMAADAGVSLGVVTGGLVIVLTGWLWVDPVISLIIVLLITAGTWSLLKESFYLSMDAVPEGISLKDVESYLKSLKGVSDVHDLHVWAMSTTEIAMTVHLVMPDDMHEDDFLKRTCAEIHQKFNIGHTTIQIERSAQNASCSSDTV